MKDRRLIEAAFPVREASLDSVHEKNVRHGHISTLHIWPARRPLAACRAALLATLLPDPGTPEKRRRLNERIAGTLHEVRTRGGKLKEETRGGILHWGREREPELARLRAEIRDAFGGRTPRVLDPFAGGGAIPLEAMRLGCETVASDLNPVAWFVLRCTLHYPRLLAGKRRPLPGFALADPEFVKALRKREYGARRRFPVGTGVGGTRSVLFGQAAAPEAEFAWHLRAWGGRVLQRARKALAGRYPTYAEFEPVQRRHLGMPPPRGTSEPDVRRKFLGPDGEGRVSPEALNAGFDDGYLADEANPRWIAKPTVAYLWARTVACPNPQCRAEIPLLKTRWLCRKPNKGVRLAMEPREDRSGVDFGVEGGASAKADAAGTMSRRGATCPCCGGIATMADLRAAGKAGRLGERMTAVVVNGQRGKEYRLPTARELGAARIPDEELEALYTEIPFGLPEEPTPKAGAGASRAFSVDGYGFDRWRTLFTARQLLALGVFVREIRHLCADLSDTPRSWREGMTACLALTVSRIADRGTALATWTYDPEKIRNTFARFALPMIWDFAESSPLVDTTGGFNQAVEWVARVTEHLAAAATRRPAPEVRLASATDAPPGAFDVICTDPPYYDAIPYSDLMDFFHVWVRRVLHGLDRETDAAFTSPLGPKWNHEKGDGELIDDAARFGGNRQTSKRNYEDGMARAFATFREALRDDGRLAIVFASKSPDAWETLVGALIRSGCVVEASWPIQTECANRQRSLTGATLSSSIWLICRKRPATARPGWDHVVLAAMETRITERLRDFWDAGIRGPDFVWSATGPALEAFSRHPAVRLADSPGRTLSVGDFLRRVRRMVVGFVVGRVVGREASGDLDDLTTYYLLHRNDFRLEPAPAGAVILYAVSCGLADSDLVRRLDLLERRGSGSAVRLKPWHRRTARGLGEPGPGGAPPPLIDGIHRTMQLWKTGEQRRVDGYLTARGFWKNDLFQRVLQAVVELADPGSGERSLLESLQNHLGAGGAPVRPERRHLPFAPPDRPTRP